MATISADCRPRETAPVMQVKPGDRLAFALFFTATLHAALIAGVTFIRPDRPPAPIMEVNLTQEPSDDRPDRADFIAQANKAGSGTLDKKTVITSPDNPGAEDTEIDDSPDPQLARMDPDRTRVTSTASASPLSSTGKEDPTPADSHAPAGRALLAHAIQLARHEARLDRQQQLHARRPRIKRLTSLSTLSRPDAFYLDSWRRKIENIGNLNYPKEARRRKIYGSLRLLVAVLPDGSLGETVLLESSGHQVLDDAAMEIVSLAAPFAPFPDELRRTTDVLEIIRTWQFRKNNSVRS